jgi:DNA-binding transcriptional MerR regulator
MNTLSEPLLSIAAVERDTGLKKDTLRVWERRYGFPQPLRDPHGDRRYPAQQVEKLKVLKRLLEQGYRPGRIIAASYAELTELAGGEPDAGGEPTADASEILALLKAHDAEMLRQRLQQLLLRQGLERFVHETVAPLNNFVGQSWLRGQIAVFEEHLYSETIANVLRNAIVSTAVPGRPPKILITTLPGEKHGLGILMAQALATLEGALCVSLGVQTPVLEVAAACRAHRADVVALSFSAAFGARQARTSLHEVRARLPMGTGLWAGGGAVLGMRRPPDGTVLIRSLDGLATAIADWRQRAPAKAGSLPQRFA